jgi:ankyrin repeat protein
MEIKTFFRALEGNWNVAQRALVNVIAQQNDAHYFNTLHDDTTPLHIMGACIVGLEDIPARHGIANSSYKTVLNGIQQHTKRVTWNNNRETAWHVAAQCGNIKFFEIAAIPLEALLHPDSNGYTPLHVAILNDQWDIVEQLMHSAHCDSIFQNTRDRKLLNIQNTLFTAIIDKIIAAYPDNFINILHSISVNYWSIILRHCTDNGPAWMAQCDDLNKLKVLARIEKYCMSVNTSWGALSVNATDSEGKTALHHAIHERNEAICLFLLDQGADSSITNNRGETPNARINDDQSFHIMMSDHITNRQSATHPDSQGCTLLHRMCRDVLIPHDIASKLNAACWHGRELDVSCWNQQNTQGYTPFDCFPFLVSEDALIMLLETIEAFIGPQQLQQLAQKYFSRERIMAWLRQRGLENSMPMAHAPSVASVSIIDRNASHTPCLQQPSIFGAISNDLPALTFTGSDTFQVSPASIIEPQANLAALRAQRLAKIATTPNLAIPPSIVQTPVAPPPIIKPAINRALCAPNEAYLQNFEKTTMHMLSQDPTQKIINDLKALLQQQKYCSPELYHTIKDNNLLEQSAIKNTLSAMNTMLISQFTSYYQQTPEMQAIIHGNIRCIKAISHQEIPHDIQECWIQINKIQATLHHESFHDCIKMYQYHTLLTSTHYKDTLPAQYAQLNTTYATRLHRAQCILEAIHDQNACTSQAISNAGDFLSTPEAQCPSIATAVHNIRTAYTERLQEQQMLQHATQTLQALQTCAITELGACLNDTTEWLTIERHPYPSIVPTIQTLREIHVQRSEEKRVYDQALQRLQALRACEIAELGACLHDTTEWLTTERGRYQSIVSTIEAIHEIHVQRSEEKRVYDQALQRLQALRACEITELGACLNDTMEWLTTERRHYQSIVPTIQAIREIHVQRSEEKRMYNQVCALLRTSEGPDIQYFEASLYNVHTLLQSLSATLPRAIVAHIMNTCQEELALAVQRCTFSTLEECQIGWRCLSWFNLQENAPTSVKLCILNATVRHVSALPLLKSISTLLPNMPSCYRDTFFNIASSHDDDLSKITALLKNSQYAAITHCAENVFQDDNMRHYEALFPTSLARDQSALKQSCYQVATTILNRQNWTAYKTILDEILLILYADLPLDHLTYLKKCKITQNKHDNAQFYVLQLFHIQNNKGVNNAWIATLWCALILPVIACTITFAIYWLWTYYQYQCNSMVNPVVRLCTLDP